MTWNDQFMELFRRCVDRYRSGDAEFEGYYSEQDRAFLGAIGYKPRELFDFVEDLVDEGVPSETTALLVAAVRRDFLLVIQEGKTSGVEISARDLPGFEESLEGIPYLPHIIRKARAKLRGELHPDLMFSCGGDRKFLREHGDIHPADFLRVTWAAGDDDRKIVEFVRNSAGEAAAPAAHV